MLDPTNITSIHAGRDFNGDDIPDAVVSTMTPGQVNHLIMYSGADGSTLFDVALFKTTSSVIIDSGPDFNGDGTTRDITT